MKCKESVELLSCYVDGELLPAERALVEEHLRGCESCRKVVEDLAGIRRAFSELLEQDAPSDLHPAIMRTVREARERSSGRDRAEDESFTAQGPERVRTSGPVGRVGETLTRWARRLGTPRAIPAIAGVLIVLMLVSSSGIIKNLLDRRVVPPVYQIKGEEDILDKGITSSRETEGAARSSGTGGQEEIAGSEAAGARLKAFGTQDSPGVLATTEVPLTGRKIIKTARMSLMVPKGGVRDALSRASAIIEGAGGYVESSSLVVGDPELKRNAEAYVVGRVPAENLTKTVQDMATLGKLVDQNESAQDVTERYVDLSARVRAKEAQEARLIQIMGEAKTVGELLQVEAELWRVRADIDSMKGQIAYLERSSALSTLTAHFAEEGAVAVIQQPGFWKDVWQAFVGAWKGIFVLGAKTLPWVSVLAVVTGVPVLLLRQRRAGRS